MIKKRLSLSPLLLLGCSWVYYYSSAQYVSLFINQFLVFYCLCYFIGVSFYQKQVYRNKKAKIDGWWTFLFWLKLILLLYFVPNLFFVPLLYVVAFGICRAYAHYKKEEKKVYLWTWNWIYFINVTLLAILIFVVIPAEFAAIQRSYQHPLIYGAGLQ